MTLTELSLTVKATGFRGVSSTIPCQPVAGCLAIDACKTKVRVSLFDPNFKEGFVSGHDFSRAAKVANDEGFSPCRSFSLSIGPRGPFGS